MKRNINEILMKAGVAIGACVLLCAPSGVSAQSTAPAAALRVGNYAEKYGWSEGDSVITVPASVRRVPDYAFAGIKGLKRVEFAEGSECRAIGAYAFAECTELEEVNLPAGIMGLGDGAFRECQSLRRMDIPRGVWFIPKECFLRCVSLEGVSMHEDVREIRDFAFVGCEKLEEFRMPEDLREIGMNAFSHCLSLEEVVIPAGVTKIESYAFSDCRGLRKVRLPKSYNQLGELVFSSCESLQEIIEPATKPPRFECNSYPFEPDNTDAYARCVLYVPAASLKYYTYHHGWSLFSKILPIP